MKLEFVSDICLKMLREEKVWKLEMEIGLFSQDGLQAFWSDLVPIWPL